MYASVTVVAFLLRYVYVGMKSCVSFGISIFKMGIWRTNGIEGFPSTGIIIRFIQLADKS